MSAVRGPFTLRALKGCKVDSRAEPLKINISQDWVPGSVEKNVAPHGLSPQTVGEPPRFFTGADAPLGPVGTGRGIMKASSQSGGGADHAAGGGYGQQFGNEDVATAFTLAKQALEAAAKVQTAPAVAMKTVCTACGVNLKEGHKFCVFCGGPVEKVPAAEPPASIAKAQAGVVAPAAKHQSRGAHSASSDVGGAAADAASTTAVTAGAAAPPGLARGLQMKLRVNSASNEVPKRSRNSLTTLLEEEFEVELEKEQENIRGA